MRAVLAVLTIAAGVGAATSAAATPVAQDLLRNFNTIVFNDFESRQHVEGALFVGGNVVKSGGMAEVNHRNVAAVDLGGGVVGHAIIGGDVQSGAQMRALNGGDIVIGGANNGAAHTTSGGAVTAGAAGVPTAAIISTLTELSANLRDLAETPGVVKNTSDRNRISFEAGTGVFPDNIVVFNIDAALLQGGGTLIGVSAPNDVTTVFNVSGTSVSFGLNGNQIRSNTLFNFYEATTVNVDRAWGYSILAPNALVNVNSTLTGTLVAKNLKQYNAEIHTPGFTGHVPPPSTTTQVSTPGGAALFLCGLSFLAARAPRRAARAKP